LSFGEIMGLVAGLFSTGSFIPQVIRVYQLKSAGDISLLFSVFFLLGGILWLSYGIHDRLLPVIIWNALGVIFTGALLVAKLMYGRRDSRNSKTNII
jgi:MtN3 and saliva related transmembrane protein